ncbi:hypothetical protein GGF46_005284 [Coemansia sp. RSA 552]|nr:hypothetical protein GGF46_005284 [Coemansia sp. RSA 552]
MTNVLISGKYPEREGTVASEGKAICPFHAAPEPQDIPQYSKTREDESMREALKLLRPTRPDFRLADYSKSFNWSEIDAAFHTHLAAYGHLPLRKQEDLSWYAVVFRSKRRVDCRDADLFEADKQAYEEAFKSTNGSLLVYWYAGLDEDHNCLATCVWSSRDIARSVNSLPRHREAARLSADVYVHYNIDRC